MRLYVRPATQTTIKRQLWLSHCTLCAWPTHTNSPKHNNYGNFEPFAFWLDSSGLWAGFPHSQPSIQWKWKAQFTVTVWVKSSKRKINSHATTRQRISQLKEPKAKSIVRRSAATLSQFHTHKITSETDDC